MKESWLECFARVVRLKNSVSKLVFSCRLLRSCRLSSRFSFFFVDFLVLENFSTLVPNINKYDILREVGALPEDSSRGVGAVEVPEKREAGSRYLGRLGGDLIFLVILVL